MPGSRPSAASTALIHQPMPSDARFTALLLAGGRSSRMGTDKARLPHPASGLSLLDHQAALLASVPGCAELLLSAPPERAYPLSGPLSRARLVRDAAPDCGPLAGLVAGLAASTHPRLLVVAVDLPFLTAEFLQDLLDVASPAVGLVPRHADDSFEPLCAVYPVHSTARACCTSALAARDLSLQKLLSTACASGWMRPHPIAAASLRHLANWNTPADLAR